MSLRWGRFPTVMKHHAMTDALSFRCEESYHEVRFSYLYFEVV